MCRGRGGRSTSELADGVPSLLEGILSKVDVLSVDAGTNDRRVDGVNPFRLPTRVGRDAVVDDGLPQLALLLAPRGLLMPWAS